VKIGIHARRGILAELTTEVEAESPLGPEIRSGTTVVCSVERLPLKPGEYWLSVKVERDEQLLDHIERQAGFWVVPSDIHGTGVHPSERDPGVVVVPHRWHVDDLVRPGTHD
jgi:hypothetical protein